MNVRQENRTYRPAIRWEIDALGPAPLQEQVLNERCDRSKVGRLQQGPFRMDCIGPILPQLCYRNMMVRRSRGA